MRGHGEKSIAVVIAIAILLYLLWKKFFSVPFVSTSVAGTTTPDTAKELNYGNVSAFGFSAPTHLESPSQYSPSAAPEIPNSPVSAFPFAYASQNTLDTAGLGQSDIKTISDVSFHPLVA